MPHPRQHPQKQTKIQNQPRRNSYKPIHQPSRKVENTPGLLIIQQMVHFNSMPRNNFISLLMISHDTSENCGSSYMEINKMYNNSRQMLSHQKGFKIWRLRTFQIESKKKPNTMQISEVEDREPTIFVVLIAFSVTSLFSILYVLMLFHSSL